MTATGRRPAVGAALRHVELFDVRSFVEARVDLVGGTVTVLTGPNGSGKTTLLEAIAFLGSQRSFRTTARDAMVRAGQERAIVRAELVREARPLLVESELHVNGGVRTLVNRHPVRGRAELAGTMPVTVFSPGDLGLVQGPPARRREVLDAAVGAVDLRAASDLDALDRVLRQRAALLRQAGGKLGSEIVSSLDVWDERLSSVGQAVSDTRRAFVAEATPAVAAAYEAFSRPCSAASEGAVVTSRPAPAVTVTYVPGWSGDLAAALATGRKEDVRRGISTVGPHRDEIVLAIDGRDARTRASQGEQRSLALALRLGLHQLVTERRGAAPLLLLDDVFSELDPQRSRALVRHLPGGQSLLTTAAALPEGIEVGAVVDVSTLGTRE